MKTEIMRPKWRSRLAERRTVRRGLRPATISFDKIGLTATMFSRDGSATKTEARWDEITSVVVYKRDLFIVDLICIGFTTAAGSFEINEEMDGWKHLTDALPGHLPGTPPARDWWAKVAQPPFAANPIPLFSR